MAKSYAIITDSAGRSTEEVTRLTGRPAHYSPLGIVVENDPLPNIERMMEQVNRALHPSACTCGYGAILHRPNCPAWLTMT